MRRTDAIAWVVSVCAVSLRLPQAKTLAIPVASAMRVQRASLANIGRAAAGTARHQVKRCWRFCANDRVEPADAMRGVAGRLVRRRTKPLLVALDWVDIKGFQTLAASAVLKGRSTPLCWASCEGHTYDGQRSRNAFEESLLLVLRSMIPQQVKVIILADRGFGRCALAAFCRRQGFSYPIRIQPKVTVKLKGFCGKLLDYPVFKGIARVLKDVAYRSDGAVEQQVGVPAAVRHRAAGPAGPQALGVVFQQQGAVQRLPHRPPDAIKTTGLTRPSLRRRPRTQRITGRKLGMTQGRTAAAVATYPYNHVRLGRGCRRAAGNVAALAAPAGISYTSPLSPVAGQGLRRKRSLGFPVASGVLSRR
jgi:hypothetical protein